MNTGQSNHKVNFLISVVHGLPKDNYLKQSSIPKCLLTFGQRSNSNSSRNDGISYYVVKSELIIKKFYLS